MPDRSPSTQSRRARKLDPPRLSQGGLSGRVYVTTVGKIIGEKDGRELIESTTKYDVTEQFDALMAERWPRCGTCDRPLDDAGICWFHSP